MKASTQRIRSMAYILLLTLVLTGIALPAAAEEDSDVTIVVTASRIPQAILDSPVSVSVITKEDIEQSGAATVADALRQVEGVTVTSNGGLGSATSFSIRGSGSSRVVVLKDGRRLGSAMNGTIDMGRLSLNGVERIEVIKGPSSALYGSDALGGVVNIITENGSQKPSAEVSVAAGSFGTKVVNLQGGGGFSGGSWWLSAEKAQSDGYASNGGYDGLFLDGTLSLDLSEAAWVTASVNHHDGEFGDWPQLDEYTRVDLAYNQQLDFDQDLSLRFFSDSSRREFAPSVHKMTTAGVDTQYNRQVAKHQLSLGGSLARDEADSTNYSGVKQRENWAVFAQDIYHASSQVALTFGGRHDDYSNYGSSTTYRVGGSYTPSSATRIYGSWSTGFRVPTFDDLYFDLYDPVWDYRWVGNPDLVPEESVGYELGLDQSLPGDLRLSLAAYHRVVDNYIGMGAESSVNLDEVVLKGWDVTAEKSLRSDLVISLGYEYLDSLDKSTGGPVNYQAKHRGSIELGWQAARNLHVLTRYNLVSERPYFAEMLPAYSVLDLDVVQRVGENLEVRASVNNILDEEYEEAKSCPAPPRQFQLGVSYSF